MNINKIFKIQNSDYSNVDMLSSELNISKLTSKILINRGLKTKEECLKFLNPKLEDLHDPFLLEDMDKAVKRIIKAIKNKENIWIYGDYDVDGVTSTSLMILFLRNIGVKCNYYIPNRLNEGYGLNKAAVDYIKNNNGELIITFDCGITSFEEVEYCRDNNIDIIITDHHQCQNILPEAYAVINPSRKDSKYPFKKLAGVGVAFKLVHALSKKLDVKIHLEQLLPIVAIGTVSDIVSLTGENRILVKYGIEEMNSCKNVGIKALLEVTGLKNKKITSGHIGFVIGPRINAAGRMGSADCGVDLFTTDDYEYALKIAKFLEKENSRRQNLEMKIFKEAEDYINQNIDLKKDKVIVVASESWHPGVIGIVSSRITEKYYKPSVVISICDNVGKGSARSISTFNLYENLYKCRDLFNAFGGHSQAAGLSIELKNIDEFTKRINRIANQVLMDEDMIPQTNIDAEISLDDLNIEIIKEIKLLEPFGIGNSLPVLILKDAKVESVKKVGKNKSHLKLSVRKNNVSLDCIGFGIGHISENINVNDCVNIIGNVEINEFMNEERVQINIKDIISDILPLNDVNSYKYLFNIIKNDYNSIDKSILKKCTTILNNIDRLKYTIELLKSYENILVVVNNIYNFNQLIKEVITNGRDIIKKTEISLNKGLTSKTNKIILNPTIHSINIDHYDKIIMYDLCFDISDIKYFYDINCTKVEILARQEDLTYNTIILNRMIPSIEELRKIYKSLISKNKEILKIDVSNYLKYMSITKGMRLNPVKLWIIFNVFNECGLLDFIEKNNYYYVKLNERPEQKIDILNSTVMVKLYSLFNDYKNLKRFLSFDLSN